MKYKNREGEESINKSGNKIIIIKYRNANDIDVYFPSFNYVVKNRQYKDFKSGNIKCPYDINKYNGYIGEGKYTSRINGRKTKCYQTWINILQRCYDKNYQSKKPTYIGCEVCEEWHNFQNFAKWYEENYYTINGEEMHIDKDILIKGNKIYSPNTCVFVPKRINDLFVNKKLNRGNYPIGVSYFKRDGLYRSEICITKNGKVEHKYLGLYKTPQEAFQVYKEYKENAIKEVANEYKKLIPKKLYEAMYRWEVEIND